MTSLLDRARYADKLDRLIDDLAGRDLINVGAKRICATAKGFFMAEGISLMLMDYV
jgi:hypothetical protein